MAGSKVSQFQSATPLTGDELVGIVQVGENAQTTTADIAALSIGGAAQEELIRDTIGAALTEGDGITITVDDTANTITITGRSVEGVQDIIGALLVDAGLATVIYDDAAPCVTVDVPAASSADTTTGTSTTKAITPDALAGSNYGKAVFIIQVSDPNGSAITTGDGKAYFIVPAVINGWNLIAVEMGLTTVSSSGIPTTQIANVTDSVDMLSTKLTVDANEFNSATAATAAVIDAAHDDVATGDILRIDNDVAGTGAKGQTVILTFQLP